MYQDIMWVSKQHVYVNANFYYMIFQLQMSEAFWCSNNVVSMHLVQELINIIV